MSKDGKLKIGEVKNLTIVWWERNIRVKVAIRIIQK